MLNPYAYDVLSYYQIQKQLHKNETLNEYRPRFSR